MFFFGVSPSTLKKKNKKKCLFSFTFLDALKKEKPFSEVVSPVGLLSLSLSLARARAFERETANKGHFFASHALVPRSQRSASARRSLVGDDNDDDDAQSSVSSIGDVASRLGPCGGLRRRPPAAGSGSGLRQRKQRNVVVVVVQIERENRRTGGGGGGGGGGDKTRK